MTLWRLLALPAVLAAVPLLAGCTAIMAVTGADDDGVARIESLIADAGAQYLGHVSIGPERVAVVYGVPDPDELFRSVRIGSGELQTEPMLPARAYGASEMDSLPFDIEEIAWARAAHDRSCEHGARIDAAVTPTGLGVIDLGCAGADGEMLRVDSTSFGARPLDRIEDWRDEDAIAQAIVDLGVVVDGFEIIRLELRNPDLVDSVPDPVAIADTAPVEHYNGSTCRIRAVRHGDPGARGASGLEFADCGEAPEREGEPFLLDELRSEEIFAALERATGGDLEQIAAVEILRDAQGFGAHIETPDGRALPRIAIG